jgi:hypothetical protein
MFLAVYAVVIGHSKKRAGPMTQTIAQQVVKPEATDHVSHCCFTASRGTA